MKSFSSCLFANPARAMRLWPAAVVFTIILTMSAGAQSLLLKSGAIQPKSIPAAKLAQMGQIQALASGERRVVLVQWSDAIDEAKLKALEAQGARLIQPIPDQGYLVSMPASVSVSLKTANAPSWSSAMDPSWKIHPEVAKSLSASSISTLGGTGAAARQVVRRYSVQVVKTGVDSAVQKTLSARGLACKTLGAMDQVQILTIEADDATVQNLSRMNSVIWIEPYREPRLASEREGTAISGNFNANYSNILGPGTYQAWMAAAGITGAGVVVHVMDDGLSQGYYSNVFGTAHPDFLGRIDGIENSTSDPLGDSGGGHGNLNASIIMGQPIAGGGMTDKDGYKLGQGIAPNAHVYATKIFNNSDLFEIKAPLDSLVSNAYIAGARISSNSWGSEAMGEYDSQAQLFDALTRDSVSSTVGLQPMAFVISAGNSGPYQRSIGSPATAKNVICVGANENTDQGVYDRSGVGPLESNDTRDVATFSSRGPTADGRLGPTVVAIGTHVPGAASDSKNFSGSGVSGRPVTSLEPGEPASNIRYYPAFQTHYTWSSGTSHSCPGVAGAAALFYEFHTKRYGAGPSPALIKAALIAGAVDPVGGQTNRGDTLGFVPNPDVGWGFATLKGIVDGGSQLFIRDQADVLRANGQVYTHDIQVYDASKPLRIVLAWTDAPGFAGAFKTLVNDLDLTVSDGATTWKGNVFSDGHSAEAGEADRLNNVECVFIPRPSPSIYTVTVTAHSLNGDAMPATGSSIEQDFAIIAANGADQTPIGRVSTDKSSYTCSDTITVSVSDTNLKGAGSASVAITSLLAGDVETLTLNEVFPPSGIMRGTIGLNTHTAIKNSGVLSVDDGDTITVTYDDTSLGGDGKPLVATAQATIDCAKPGVTDVFVSSITDETAQINVTASEAARMTIIYGPAGAETQYQVSGGSNEITQTFALSNLTPGTPYFFKINMTDSAGNVALVGDTGDLYFAFQTRSHIVQFSDNMESGEGDWTHGAAIGTDDWLTTTSSYARSASNAWIVTDPETIKDDLLITPSIALPAGDVRLEFWHTFQFESAGLVNGYDGGVLEISTDGGSMWTDLGQHMMDGGYNANISIYFGNPLAGRRAWSGGMFGTMRRVLVDLSSFAGQSIKIRWRIGCDSSTAGLGWHVDDVSVYALGDETTDLAMLRFDRHGVATTIAPLRFTIRDTQFATSNGGATPADFRISVPGRLAPVAITPAGLQAISEDQDVWEGYLSVAAGANGHVIVGGALDVVQGETVRLTYYDSNAGNDAAAYVSDEIAFDCQPPSLIWLAQTFLTDNAAHYHLIASEPVAMTVHYGAAANALNSVQQATELSTTHDILLEDLLACTPYYFTIDLIDAAGNKSVIKNAGQAYGFRTSQQSVVLDTLEPQPTGAWTHSAAAGADDWSYQIAPTSWNYAQRAYVRSGSNAWSCQDVNGIKDIRLTMPPVNIASTMKLSFWHTYQTEKKFDGGVIEISLDGGSTWNDLGSEIERGHYNEALSGAYGSALAYRMAWTGGTFGPMTQVMINLSKYAGNNRLIRFRFACDKEYGGGGWMIDDIGLVTFQTCGEQFPPAPTIASPANNAKGVAFSGTQLKWAAVSGATSYDVYFGTSADSVTTMGTTTTNLFVITPRVLKAGHTYYWRVRAFNSVGAGDLCPVSAFKTATVDPARIAGYIIGNAAALLTSEKTAVDYNDDGKITIDELVTNVNLSR